MQSPPESPEEQLRWLVDRASVEDLATEYARCLDDREFDAWTELFTEDGVVEMPFARVPRDELVAAAHGLLGKYPRTHHIFGQADTRIDGDTAVSRRHFLAVHVPDPGDDRRHADVAGFHEHHLRRTAEGWRFVLVRATFVWTQGEALVP